MLEFSVKRHLMASEVKLLSSLLPSSLFLTSRGCMGSTWGQKASVKHWSTRRSTCCYCWVVSRSVRRPRYHSWPGWAVGRRSPAWSPSVSGAGVRCASALSPESLSPSPGGIWSFGFFLKGFFFFVSFLSKTNYICSSRMRFLVKRWHRATGMSSTASCAVSKNGTGQILGNQSI